MRAGTLNQRITIERPTVAADSFGGSVKGWVDLAANIPASIIPLTGGESFGNAQVEGVERFSIFIRYSSIVADIAPNDRIKVLDAIPFYLDINFIADIYERQTTIEVEAIRQ